VENSEATWKKATKCNKQQYQGEIALFTNLMPLMSEQLLKFGYNLYCLNSEYLS
jgi:hypothetical protein